MDWVVIRTLSDNRPYAAATTDWKGMHRALIRDRDEFDAWFCDHERPTW